MGKIQEYKREIAQLRVHLAAREDQKVADLENQVTFLKARLAQLEDEQNSLKTVEKRQSSALSSLNNDAEMKRLEDKIATDMTGLRDKEKGLKQRIATGQAEWKAVHEQMVAVEERYREVQRRKPGAPTPESEAQAKELAEYQRKVEILTKSNKTDLKMLKAKNKEIQQRVNDAEEDTKRMSREKVRVEQEIALKELKQKELKALLTQLQKRNAELEALRRVKEAKEETKSPKAEPADAPTTLFSQTQVEDSL